MPRPSLPPAPFSRARAYTARHAALRPRLARTAVAGLAVGGLVAGGMLVTTDRDADAWPGTTVTVVGHGYGHGRGMSQYGAYGYATMYGWNYQQILAHYYGGTVLGTAANTPIRVAISSLEGSTSLTVTSGIAFTAGGVRVPAGAAATVQPVSGGYRVAVRPRGCGQAAGAPTSTRSAVVSPGTTNPDAPAGQLLAVCGNGILVRGSLSWVAGNHVVNTLPVESYLRGSVPHESPASWADAAGGKGIAALQAQAVAARTYALNQHRYGYADICDNQNCQMYTGAGSNGQLTEDARANRAVAGTAGRVLRNRSGALVSAEYSSSSGGYTAGGAFPAVPDLGDVASPNHNWQTTLSAASVGSAFGVGTLHGLTVTQRNGLGVDGGRVVTIRVVGSGGTVTVSGGNFASTFGLRSDWFSIAPVRLPGQLMISASPPVRPATTYAPVALRQTFGATGDVPLACHFAGGKDGAAVWRDGTLYYRQALLGGAGSLAVKIGRPGDQPICGDWNGDGVDTPGVYRSATRTFFLAAATRTASPLTRIVVGLPGDEPVVGDWDGDGRDSVGLFRPSTSTFYLLSATGPGATIASYRFGRAGDVPIAGDWSGTGRDRYGVFRNGLFYLAPYLGAGAANAVRFGLPGDVPMLGDWNGDGRDEVAIGRNYTQY